MQAEFEVAMLLCFSANLGWSILSTLRAGSAASKHRVTVMLVSSGALCGVMAKLSVLQTGGGVSLVQLISLFNSAAMVADIALVVWFSRRGAAAA